MAAHPLSGSATGFYSASPDSPERPPVQPTETDVQNPFALMTSPEAVFAAIERSDRLARLKSTICRPLDKPRPEKPLVELRAFDDAIESIDTLEDFGTQD